MKATNKSPEIEAALFNFAGKSRIDTIARGECMFCEAKNLRSIISFRDHLSLKEYRISGMCQDCQDAVFSEEEEE